MTLFFSVFSCLPFAVSRLLFLSSRCRPGGLPITVALSPSFSFSPLHLAPFCSSSGLERVATPAVALVARTESEVGREAEEPHGNVREKEKEH